MFRCSNGSPIIKLKKPFQTILQNVVSFQFFRCNVSKQSDWEVTWNYVEKSFGKPIDLLINNAGVSPAFGWKMCLDVNIYGVMMGSYTARDRMGKTKVAYRRRAFEMLLFNPI